MTTPVPGPGDSGLPPGVAAAVRKAAQDLYRALDPYMTASGTPAREVTTLWQTAKMLAAVSGGLDMGGDVPAGGLHRARWEEAASIAEDITAYALKIVADGMTPVQAAEYLADDPGAEVWGLAASSAATLEVAPPDEGDTMRSLTVAVDLQPRWSKAAGAVVLPPLAVTASRGPAPEPRPHTASTVLRAGHALATAAAVLGELVLEKPADGIPYFIGPHQEVTCEVCGAPATHETYRRVEVGTSGRHADVCSVPCARAAHAGESRE
jgi:hypothetical protein